MPLPYPTEWEDRFKDLEKRVVQQFSSIQNRQPVTKSSAGFEFAAQSEPDTPASGGRIYADDSSDQPYWKDSSGSVYSLKTPPFPRAAAVANLGSMSSGQISGTPTQAQYNALQADAAATRNKLNELLNALRAVLLIDV